MTGKAGQGSSGGPSLGPSPGLDDVHNQFDVFCHMVFEEFLMRKNLFHTLAAFRREWGRPTEETTLLSWYETALKLRLPELVSAGSAEATVMENIVWALVRESSIKSRRDPEVTVSGLATLPRQRQLPSLLATAETSSAPGTATADAAARSSSPALFEDYDTYHEGHSVSNTALGAGAGGSASARLRRKKADEAAAARKEEALKKKATAAKKGFGTAVPLGQSSVHLSEEAALVVKRQIEEMQAEKALQQRLKGLSKVTSENWIPEIQRMRSLERDLIVAKENLSDIRLREMGEAREMKQFRVTELERALKAESLGKMTRLSCGCCMLTFLPINLPLKVSQKAILDIRVKWSGGLSSATVFVVPGQPASIANGDVPQLGEGSNSNNNNNNNNTITEGAADGGVVVVAKTSKSQKSFIDKMAERLSVVPRCYDEVPVCTFCAQFFQESEGYRPSYDKIYFEERKANFLATQAQNKLKWDPLLLVERDREQEEQIASISIAGSSTDISKDPEPVALAP